MNEQNLYTEFSSLLKNKYNRNRILLFRGEDERNLLSEWMQRSDRKDNSSNIKDISLKEIVENCSRCGDVDERKFPIGSGENGVMIILNSPRLVKRVEKQILKKESVDLLKKIVKAMNLKFNECYITNMIKCDVKDPLIKPSQVFENCEYIIQKEIDIIKPRIAIVFGDIIPLQKIIKESIEIYWYNIEHPITLIKNPDLKRSAWNTLKIIMEKMRE